MQRMQFASLLPVAVVLLSMGTSVLQADSLEAHWDFDQVGLSPGDTAADGSGFNRDATLQGNATTAAGGKLGGALSLDGSTGTWAEAVGYPGVLGNNARTISAWIRPAGTTPVQEGIISWGANTANLERWTVRTDTTGAGGQSLRAEFSNAAIHDNENIVLFDQAFHHVAVSMPTGGTRADHELYIDGVKITSVTILGSQSGPINTNALKDVLIGGRTRGDGGTTPDDFPFAGLIDDVAIFSEQLSDAQVAAIFNLADSSLQYDVGNANELFEINGGGSVLIGDLQWQFVPGLTGTPLGSVVEQNGQFLLALDGTGTLVGAAVVPEPASVAIWSLLGLAAVGFVVWQRRR